MVAKLAAQSDPAVICDAVQVLGRRRAVRSVPLLTRLAEHENENVAMAAIEALGRIGGTREGGEGLLSYLLFDGGFCQALIDLGYRDAQTRRVELETFLAPGQYCELPNPD